MFNSLWVAKTGMEAQDMRVGVIANNMANSSTTGFKKDLAHFTSLSYSQVRGRGAAEEGESAAVGGVALGQGVKVSDTSKIFTQGSIKETGSNTDFMIGGDGYFVLVDDDGREYFTRDGHFELAQDPNNAEAFNLVHVASGFKMVSVDDRTGGVVDTINLEPLSFDPPRDEVMGPMTLDRDGQLLLQTDQGDDQFVTPVYIPIARFGAKSGLVAQAGGVYQDDPARTGGPTYLADLNQAGFGSLRHQALENSNVTVIDEMVDMIEAQRGYEMGAKVLEKSDEMMSTLIQRT